MMPSMHSRREFLATLSSAGAAGVLGADPSFAQEGTPEISTLRLSKVEAICIAPHYLADELLRAEGFDVQYVPTTPDKVAIGLARSEFDFSSLFSPSLLMAIDAGEPITIVGGEHIGCFELFAREGIRGILDLKGKNVGVQSLGSPMHLFITTMAVHVGLDPAKDIRWVTGVSPSPMELFAAGKIDAFLGFPPEPQELRARGIARVIVNSVLDRPWSQYFCCMLAANTEFLRKHPIATKRVLRAVIKAAELCTAQPEWAAQRIIDGGFAKRYDFALQAIKDLPYARWRDYAAEDTIRYYALRLHEAKIVKSPPSRLMAQGTDWRFWNELRRELKS